MTRQRQETSVNNPPSLAAVFRQAVHYHRQGRLQQAAKAYEHVLGRQPGNFEALLYYGILAGQLHRFPYAATLLSRAVEQNPSHAGAHYNLALALRDSGRPLEAVASFEAAIALKPDAIFCYDLSRVLMSLERFDAAVEVLDRAVTADPDLPYLAGYRLYVRRSICDWQASEDELHALERRIREGNTVAPAFPLLLLSDSPELQQINARALVAQRWPDTGARPPAPVANPVDKVRVGYFSSDFRRHPLSYLLRELFERHDRDRFEITAFVFPPQRDEVSKQVEGCFDEVIDVSGMPDRTVAELARKKGIEIAVDVNGHTDNCRPGIFAARAAPVQVNYLGYPGTSGAPYMDYILADGVVIPRELEHCYTEHVVRLPHCYMPNDTAKPVAQDVPDRAGLGLPGDVFVFCCFNNAPKITPDIFACWMRILQRVPRSVLWLLGYNPGAEHNLRRAAETAGVAPERLHFAPKVPMERHLARHAAADLFLDTFPYNAHTTANDALWMGLPVLTLAGRSFASRVASSMLKVLDLHELVTASPGEYEEKAVGLAENPEHLKYLRDRLRGNRDSGPLYDMAVFSRDLESAFTGMAQRHRGGLPPAGFSVG